MLLQLIPIQFVTPLIVSEINLVEFSYVHFNATFSVFNCFIRLQDMF